MWSSLWPGRMVALRPEPLDELRTILADHLGVRQIECAFQFGASGIYNKTVILVMDPAGRSLAYAKLATLAIAQEAVRHETSVLKRLSTAVALRSQVPCLLGAAEWRGFPLLLISPGPARRAPQVFGAMHRDFLARLRDATCTPGAFTESPMWHAMMRLVNTWSSRLSPEWRNRYDWAFIELERRLGSVRLDLAFAHHDFAPWNTRVNADGTLFVFDWEFSRDGWIPAWDFFHFHVTWWAARARALDGDAVTNLVAAARREGIEPADDLLLGYLTDVALFHHDAMLREGREHHRVLELAAQGIDVLRK